MAKPVTAAIYLRISQDPREDGLAVERQEAECRAIIAAKNWVLGEIYSDTVSASKKNVTRPNYDRMLLDFKRGKFVALVCWDLDRLTRQPRQLEDWIEAAEEDGLLLVTANGEADLTNDNGRLFARMKAIVSKAEMERKGARQKAKNAQLVASGFPVPGRRRWGYESDNKTPHTEEATRVQNAFEQVAMGKSLRSVAIELGVKPVRLRESLTHRSYVGEVKHLGEFLPSDKIQPLVSKELFEQVQAILSDPTRKTTPGNTVRHLMSGLAKCGICDSTMYYMNGYLCSGATNHVHIKKEYLENLVVLSIKDWVGRNRTAPTYEDSSDELVPLVQELQEVERLRVANYQFAEAEGADLKYLMRRIKELGEQANDLERKIRQTREMTAKSSLLEDMRRKWWEPIDGAGFDEWKASMDDAAEKMGWEHEGVTVEQFIHVRKLDRAFDDWFEYWNELDIFQQREIVKALITVVVNKGRGNERVEVNFVA